MSAFVLRLSGLRAVCERCGALVRTPHISTLSMALRSPQVARFAAGLVGALPGRAPTGGLVAVDSMCLSLPRTRRHGCARLNDTTVGLGVLFALAIDHHRGQRPAQVLATFDGPWHDGSQIRPGLLAAHGPVHLMDRGFYTLANLNGWLAEGVHFIVRARGKDLVWRRVRVCGPARRAEGLVIEHDVIAEIGGPDCRIARPRVRLVFARLADGRDLVLVSDQERWSAERLLAAYRRRWKIERFHHFLKESVGLAHLYSYQQRGLETLLWVSVLLVGLLMLRPASSESVQVMLKTWKTLRRAEGLAHLWRPNTVRRKRGWRGPPGRSNH